MEILVTGGAGQVGLELARQDWWPDARLLMPDRSDLDIASMASVGAYFGERNIAAVINAAAYTAVDKAENDSAAAFSANAQGPANLAEVTRKAGIPLIHLSTDYVFDGEKNGPYLESDPVSPLGSYGASKLAGEIAVLSGNPRSIVMRTAWVLSPHRSNFVKTMLRVAASNDVVRVVDDQLGNPTSAADIASTLKDIVSRMVSDEKAPRGIYHFVNAGSVTWCGLAREIFELSRGYEGPAADVIAITTADYPTPARRPANSRLATDKISRDFGIEPRDWRGAVADIIADLKAATSEYEKV